MAGGTSVPYLARATLSEATVMYQRVPEISSLEQEVHFGKGNIETAAYSDPEHR